MNPRGSISMILAVALAALSAQSGAATARTAKAGAVSVDPLPFIYGASATYSLKANGIAVPAVDFSEQYDYATFTLADGPCTIEVSRRDGKPITRSGVSPQKLGVVGAVAGASLSFTIDEAQYLIVAVDDLRKLVIAIDPPEKAKPASSGGGIFNVTWPPYLADASGIKPATAAIQRAADDAGKDPAKHGVVYVPAGVYDLSELRLPGNVTLYLDGGAVLRLSGKRGDFKIRFHKKSRNADGTWFIHTADGATNVKILGRGTIDGDGRRIEKNLRICSHLVVPMNCTDFTMDGPIVRDSGLWGTVIANSRQVALRNTKHFNRLDMGEDDCVDLCNSQDVSVQRSIAISLDDPYSTKTWSADSDIARQWGPTRQTNRNIVFDGCVAWTRCFAFKIGAGVWQDQENVTVRDAVVYDAAHAIGISHSFGSADIRNVMFDTIDVERNTLSNLGCSWARFVIDSRRGDGGNGGGVYDVCVRNINVRDAGTDPVPVQGLSADKAIRGLSFEAIRMNGRATAARTLADIGVGEPRNAQDVRITPVSQGEALSEGSHGPEGSESRAAGAHSPSATREMARQ